MGGPVDGSGTSAGESTDTSTDTGGSSTSGEPTSGPSATDEAGSSTGVSSTGTATGSMPSATGEEGGEDTGLDDGPWCTDDYDPVCGKDGETYDHPCSAIAAGVGIKHDGPCFGDCEGSCSVGGSPLTLGFALAGVLLLRVRRRRIRPIG